MSKGTEVLIAQLKNRAVETGPASSGVAVGGAGWGGCKPKSTFPISLFPIGVGSCFVAPGMGRLDQLQCSPVFEIGAFISIGSLVVGFPQAWRCVLFEVYIHWFGIAVVPDNVSV